MSKQLSRDKTLSKMNTQSKVAKKAYTEIKRIQTASNMVEVESCINTAVLKTFGLNDMGLMKISMRDYPGSLLNEHYGCAKYNGNFPMMKTIRTNNAIVYGGQALEYIMSFIPERMKATTMYKNAINKPIEKYIGSYLK